MPPKRFYIETFGCQMNLHDSEKIKGVLCREGHIPVDNAVDSDLIVFNTCSIRQKAEQKFFSELGRIRKLKRKNPDLRIAVVGCIAQQQGRGIFKRAPYVDYVVGPQNIHLLHGLIGGDVAAASTEDNPDLAQVDLPVLREGAGRAWVSIMYGCNNFCSYCVVPYTRGPEKSRPAENILGEISGIAAQGYKEVTLLGQNVNSYQSSLDFSGLLERANEIKGLERIRFVTSHPRDLSGGLVSAMERLSKVCEHMHLPLQSGSDTVLRRMNRGYTFGEYRERVRSLRSKVPGIAVTTDIITGFPGESEQDHQETVAALKELEFDGIFAFKYSPRSGTRAALMDCQVSDEIKSERLTELLEIQDGITVNLNNKLEHTVQEILVEGPSETEGKIMTGRTRANKIVNFEGDESLVGSICTVRIVKTRKHSLDGILQ